MSFDCDAAQSPIAADRFWGKVRRGVGADDCWEWAGATNSKGYGVISVGGRLWLAHRFAYALAVSDPGAAQVLHRCDNRVCVRPDHLAAGTAADNAADMVAKGRQPRGESHGQAKLTAGKVAAIRLRRADGVTWVRIAAEFGVSERQARDVARGRAWKHVPAVTPPC
ncbi:HNH endonuclease [Limnoglobus roseus]|uniref:HNH endonuclease n=1 Tax=Limnoglobus roseus TaxID=2598579 RepID=A0A5C1A6D8_9BACT|nr:HNH endonuclease [Limnoglobus roseus]QEL14280.1 HNH endonuclease [Limnoglobus roseus]